MTPAAWPRERPQEERLLHVDPGTGSLADHSIADLPGLLRAGDLLVVNDAATLPASLPGQAPGGDAIEVRLAARAEPTWTAVLFGAGDWTLRTEDRPPPPIVPVGAALTFDGLSAVVRSVDPESPRLVDLEFDRDGEALWSALYRCGRPVQYSYLRAPLPLWHTQTAYASRPWAMETPSAGRPLTWDLLVAIRAREVAIAPVTHAAGLSSTGDPALDARLPLPERFEVPEATVAAIAAARERKGRVVAVGTTVVRALEGAALSGALRSGAGITHLRIGPGFRAQVCDGVLTGMHEPDSSHFALLTPFAPPDLLSRAHRHAEGEGYLAHEFGDSTLVLSAV